MIAERRSSRNVIVEFNYPWNPYATKIKELLSDGAMSILVGIAARKSIEKGEPVRVAALTDLKPRAERF